MKKVIMTGFIGMAMIGILFPTIEVAAKTVSSQMAVAEERNTAEFKEATLTLKLEDDCFLLDSNTQDLPVSILYKGADYRAAFRQLEDVSVTIVSTDESVCSAEGSNEVTLDIKNYGTFRLKAYIRYTYNNKSYVKIVKSDVIKVVPTDDEILEYMNGYVLGNQLNVKVGETYNISVFDSEFFSNMKKYFGGQNVIKNVQADWSSYDSLYVFTKKTKSSARIKIVDAEKCEINYKLNFRTYSGRECMIEKTIEVLPE